PMLNDFASIFNSSVAVLSVVEAPAFNISKPYASKSTLAIDFNASAASISSCVQVGDLNNKLSEIIAEIIKPAISGLISNPRSLYILYKIVAVQPTGSAR